MTVSLLELMKKRWLFLPVYIGITLLHIRCGEKPVTYVAGNDWDAAGGNTGQTKYSTLNQINKENVGQLEIAWTFHSGSKAGNVQLNPLIVSGVRQRYRKSIVGAAITIRRICCSNYLHGQ